MKINDKHIEVIVRQMLRRIEIDEPGDMPFIQGEQIERAEVLEENEKAEKEGKKPATYRYMLLGITKDGSRQLIQDFFKECKGAFGRPFFSEP